jgi:hypothetical protein
MLGSPSKESVGDTGYNNENNRNQQVWTIRPSRKFDLTNDDNFYSRRKSNTENRKYVTFTADKNEISKGNFKSDKLPVLKKKKTIRKVSNYKNLRIRKKSSSKRRIEIIEADDLNNSYCSESESQKQSLRTEPEIAIGNYFENIFKKVKKLKKEEELLKKINFNLFEKIIDHWKHSSLGIFHIKSTFRRKVITVVDSKGFELTMMVLIFLSCLNIILQNPFLDINSTYFLVLESLDEFFTLMFFIEMILKVIAYGFIFDNIKKHQMKSDATGEIVNYYVEDDFETEEMKRHVDNLELQYKNSENRSLKKLEEENLQSLPKIKKEISIQQSRTNNLNLNLHYGISEDNINYKNDDFNKNNVQSLSFKSPIKNNLSMKDISRNIRKEHGFQTTNKKTLGDKNVLNATEFFKLRNENSVKKEFRFADVVDEYLKNIKIDKPVLEKEIFIMKKAYLKDIWNVMDLIILICSLVYFFGSKQTTIKTLKTVRAMRALIPLRVINRFEKVRTLVKCVLQSIPAIGNLILISFIFLFIYAVIGVNLYKGIIGTCSNPSLNNSVDCRGKGHVWTSNSKYNFDNVFNSLMIIFQLTLAQGWKMVLRS